jgi:hypothetical protein
MWKFKRKREVFGKTEEEIREDKPMRKMERVREIGWDV